MSYKNIDEVVMRTCITLLHSSDSFPDLFTYFQAWKGDLFQRDVLIPCVQAMPSPKQNLTE